MELTEKNYFSSEADMEYISNSQIKSFLECEARALAELKGEYKRPQSDTLLQGSLLDVLLTGTEEEQEQFLKENPQIVSSRGDTKGQLKREYQKILEMANRAKSDEYFMKTMSGKKQVIMTGKLYGSNVKIKIDVLHDNAIVDLKSAESIGKRFYVDGSWKSFIDKWGYVLQGALYQEIVRQNTGNTLPFFLSVVSKQDEPDIEIIQIDNESMKTELTNIADLVPHIQALKDGKYEPTRCGHCAYCRKTKKLSKPINWQNIQLED